MSKTRAFFGPPVPLLAIVAVIAGLAVNVIELRKERQAERLRSIATSETDAQVSGLAREVLRTNAEMRELRSAISDGALRYDDAQLRSMLASVQKTISGLEQSGVEMRGTLASVEKGQADLTQWAHVKAVPDLDIRKISATTTSVRQKLSVWNPASEEELPLPWPVTKGVRRFAPYIFAQNASVIASKIKEGTLRADQGPMPYLLQSLAEHSVVTSSGAKFLYDYSVDYLGGTLPANWHSAFGDAAIIFGLCELYEATKDEALLELAQKYAASLDWNGKPTDVLMVDSSGYLWFEETPPVAGKPTHILNGHIFATFALIRLSQVSGDRSLEPLIRAGLATAARYLWQVRNPGRVSNYSPSFDSPDYGPDRIVIYAKALNKITGNQSFAEAALALITDQ